MKKGFFTEFRDSCTGRKINSQSGELLQHPADRSSWLSDSPWPATLPRPRGHRSFARRDRRRAGTLLLGVRRIPSASALAVQGAVCSARISPRNRRQSHACPSEGLTSKGWMPAWSNGVAGHWASDRHRDRSAGCWSSSRLSILRPASRSRHSAMNRDFSARGLR